MKIVQIVAAVEGELLALDLNGFPIGISSLCQ